LRIIQAACKQNEQDLVSWDQGDGFQNIQGELRFTQTSNTFKALQAIEEKKEKSCVFVLPDFHMQWSDIQICRKLRNLATAFRYTQNNIIIVRPPEEGEAIEILPELRNHSVRLEIPPPSLSELTELLKQLLQAPNASSFLGPLHQRGLAQAALGLSEEQASLLFCRAIVSEGRLDYQDLEYIRQERNSQIQQSGALQILSNTLSLDDLGGMAGLKQWLKLRKASFEERGRQYGLPSPKGILLAGIPGTGKSLSARVVAYLFQLPLIRFSFDSLLAKWFGESDQNLRKALADLERLSPCVVWIDELEKIFHSKEKHETTARMLARFLMWLQERKEGVFIVATVNELSALPTELTRRGRFDAIFFLDIPTLPEREDIISIHLRKREKKIENFDIQRLAKASFGHVGSEIEAAIVDALFLAYNDPDQPGREVTTEDIETSMKSLIPLSKSHKEHMESLQKWVTQGRAVSASDVEFWL